MNIALISKADQSSKVTSHWKSCIGLGLIGLSFPLYGGLFLVHQSTLSTKVKVTLSSALVICGEVSFWLGSLVLGKEFISKYRNRLDPRRWF